MVLTDDNFATIEGGGGGGGGAAVEEGRGVFDNLTKFIVWILPTNVGQGAVILVAVAAGVTLPILPVQILWLNMVTAVLLGLMLAFEPKEPGIMQRPPRDPKTPLLTRELMVRILIVGGLLVAGSFGLFEWELIAGHSEETARTVAVNVFVMVQTFYLFKCRSLTRSVLEIGLFSNIWVWVGVVHYARPAAFFHLSAGHELGFPHGAHKRRSLGKNHPGGGCRLCGSQFRKAVLAKKDFLGRC